MLANRRDLEILVGRRGLEPRTIELYRGFEADTLRRCNGLCLKAQSSPRTHNPSLTKGLVGASEVMVGRRGLDPRTKGRGAGIHNASRYAAQRKCACKRTLSRLIILRQLKGWS